MTANDWTIKEKPYDLRERLLLFACTIVRLVQYLHTRGPVAVALSYQLLKSGTSAGANYEEADDGSSERDALAKKKIVLLRRCNFLTAVQDPVTEEASELIRIVATIVRRSDDALCDPDNSRS